jgi:hypothetical protein
VGSLTPQTIGTLQGHLIAEQDQAKEALGSTKESHVEDVVAVEQRNRKVLFHMAEHSMEEHSMETKISPRDKAQDGMRIRILEKVIRTAHVYHCGCDRCAQNKLNGYQHLVSSIAEAVDLRSYS